MLLLKYLSNKKNCVCFGWWCVNICQTGLNPAFLPCVSSLCVFLMPALCKADALSIMWSDSSHRSSFYMERVFFFLHKHVNGSLSGSVDGLK